MVCSQEAKVTEKLGAHNPSARYVSKDPTTLPQANGTLVLSVNVGFQDEQKRIRLEIATVQKVTVLSLSL